MISYWKNIWDIVSKGSPQKLHPDFLVQSPMSGEVLFGRYVIPKDLPREQKHLRHGP